MSNERKPPVDPTTEDAATQPPRSRTEPAPSADATVRDVAQAVAAEQAAAEAPVYVEPGRPVGNPHEDSTTSLNLAQHPPPAPQGPVAAFLALPRAARGLIVAGVGLVVASGLIYALLPDARPAPAQTGPTEAQRLAQLMSEGQAALQQKQYGVAVAAFEAVQHLAPDNAEASRLLAQATRARDDEAKLEAARRALEGMHFDEARQALSALPEGSELAAQAKALAEQVRAGEGAALLAQGEAQVQAGQLDEAKATLAKLQPLDAASADKLSAEIAAPPAPSASAPPAPASAPRPGADPELAPALAAFASDAAAGASALEKLAQSAKSPAARKRAQALAASAKACAQAGASAKAPNPVAAELEAGLPRCTEVAPEAAPTRALREALTALYAKQAQEGLAADDKPKAAQAYRRLLALEPGNARAQQSLQKLVEQAHERYLGAYVLSEKDPDEAAKQLQEVLHILSPEDADYAKAKSKLSALKPGR